MKEQIFSKSGLFSPSGRRAQIPFVVMSFVFGIVGKIGIVLFMGSLRHIFHAYLQLIIPLGWWIFIFYLDTINTVKRLHDLNYNGLIAIPFSFFYIIIAFLPTRMAMRPIPLLILIVELVFWLFLAFKKGTDGDNKYGSDPLKQ